MNEYKLKYKMIDEIRVKYQFGHYKNLLEQTNSRIDYKRYFSGSEDNLGFYEPSLFKPLQESWLFKGNFRKINPVEREIEDYHIYYYDKNHNLVKMESYGENSYFWDLCSEFLIVNNGVEKLYLGYVKSDNYVTLEGIWRFLYDEEGRLIEYVSENNDDLTVEKYYYNGHNLVKSELIEEDKVYHLEFFYGEDGYADFYSQYDELLNRKTEHVNISKKDILAFEKRGNFHFSPKKNKC